MAHRSRATTTRTCKLQEATGRRTGPKCFRYVSRNAGLVRAGLPLTRTPQARRNRGSKVW